MSATYNEMLKRLIEERKRLGLSQQQMARLVHITQSNYSKVEKGLHRLSYEELKYLSKANIDIFYIFTGYRCAGKYVAYFQQCAYVELCCYLGIIQRIYNRKVCLNIDSVGLCLMSLTIVELVRYGLHLLRKNEFPSE